MFRVQPTLPSLSPQVSVTFKGFQGATAEGASPTAGALQASWEEPEWAPGRRDSHRGSRDGHKVRVSSLQPSPRLSCGQRHGSPPRSPGQTLLCPLHGSADVT